MRSFSRLRDLRLLAGALFVGFVAIALVAVPGRSQAFDQSVLELASGLRRPAVTTLVRTVTRLGSGTSLALGTTALALGLFALREVRAAFFAIGAMVGAGLLNLGTKTLFGRARPLAPWSLDVIDGFAFPSGHAMGAMALAMTTLVVIAVRIPRWTKAAIAILGVYVLAMGGTRVYLGVHFATDVLAGWSLGGAWVLAFSLVTIRRDVSPRPNEPAPTTLDPVE